MTLLSDAQLNSALGQLPGWEVRDGHLTKTFAPITFAHAVMFIGAVGQYADAMGHHPDISLHDYNKVTIRVMTHSAGGLTQKDVDLAARVERIPHKPPKKA